MSSIIPSDPNIQDALYYNSAISSYLGEFGMQLLTVGDPDRSASCEICRLASDADWYKSSEGPSQPEVCFANKEINSAGKSSIKGVIRSVVFRDISDSEILTRFDDLYGIMLLHSPYVLPLLASIFHSISERMPALDIRGEGAASVFLRLMFNEDPNRNIMTHLRTQDIPTLTKLIADEYQNYSEEACG